MFVLAFWVCSIKKCNFHLDGATGAFAVGNSIKSGTNEELESEDHEQRPQECSHQQIVVESRGLFVALGCILGRVEKQL